MICLRVRALRCALASCARSRFSSSRSVAMRSLSRSRRSPGVRRRRAGFCVGAGGAFCGLDCARRCSSVSMLR